MALETGRRLQTADSSSTKSRAIWSTALSDREHPPENSPESNSPESTRRTDATPPARILAATAVALASLAVAVVILFLTPADSGLAAACAVATTGLALAGQLSGPPR